MIKRKSVCTYASLNSQRFVVQTIIHVILKTCFCPYSRMNAFTWRMMKKESSLSVSVSKWRDKLCLASTLTLKKSNSLLTEGPHRRSLGTHGVYCKFSFLDNWCWSSCYSEKLFSFSFAFDTVHELILNSQTHQTDIKGRVVMKMDCFVTLCCLCLIGQKIEGCSAPAWEEIILHSSRWHSSVFLI